MLTYKGVPAGKLWSCRDVSFPFGPPVCFKPNPVLLFACYFSISVIALSIESARSSCVGFRCLDGLGMALKTISTGNNSSDPVV